jgi:hypothetical protein
LKVSQVLEIGRALDPLVNARLLLIHTSWL